MSDRLIPELFVETMSDGTATVAHVDLETDEYIFHGSGSSRRIAGDKHDPELGELLALARALENMLVSVQARAARRVKANAKKASERENYKTLAQWEAEQAQARAATMAAHPAGKKRKK